MAEEPADAPAEPETGTAEVPTSTEAIQTVQRIAWIRGISIFIGVSVLLIALGWIAGSIANRLAETPDQRALAELAAADDRIVVAADAPIGVEATLHWASSLGSAAFIGSGLPRLDAGMEFVVWYVDGDAYAPVVTFTAATGSASVLLPETWEPAQSVVVSIQAEDASADAPEPEPLLTFEPPGSP